MKKILAAICVCLLGLALCACGEDAAPSTESGRLTVDNSSPEGITSSFMTALLDGTLGETDGILGEEVSITAPDRSSENEDTQKLIDGMYGLISFEVSGSDIDDNDTAEAHVILTCPGDIAQLATDARTAVLQKMLEDETVAGYGVPELIALQRELLLESIATSGIEKTELGVICEYSGRKWHVIEGAEVISALGTITEQARAVEWLS